MNDYRTKRFMIWQNPFDPVWHLTDLLYFDQIIAAPGVMQNTIPVLLDSWGVPPKLPRLLDELEESELIIRLTVEGDTPVRDFDADSSNYVQWIANEFERELPDRARKFASAGLTGSVRLNSVEGLEAYDKVATQVAAREYRNITNRCARAGFNIALKYDRPESFSNAFPPGRDEALSIIFNALPALDANNYSTELVDFLKDEETRAKRRRLFSWLNDIQPNLQAGDLNPTHVSELICTRLDDYDRWLKKNHLKLREVRREFVVFSLLSALSVVGLPAAVAKYFEFRRLKLDLMDDEKAPGREFAYIAAAKERFKKRSSH
jgi:hypothetical protein